MVMFLRPTESPVVFLQQLGRVEKEGYALALKEEMRDVIGLPGFAEQIGDAIRFRAVDYFRRRYSDSTKGL